MITFLEIFYMLVVTLVLGFIFYDNVRASIPKKEDDLISAYTRKFDWNSFYFAVLTTAPGVILHELGHKFIALFFGLGAVFKIWTFGLGLAFILKLVNSPFLIIAPGYVEISGGTTYLQEMLISFAGPGVNLLLFLIAFFMLKSKKKYSHRTYLFLNLTKRINLILFVFNMIPIPPLDGSKVFYSLYKLLF